MRLVEIAKGKAVNPEHVIRVYQDGSSAYVVLNEIIRKGGQGKFGIGASSWEENCEIKSDYDYQETLSRLHYHNSCTKDGVKV